MVTREGNSQSASSHLATKADVAKLRTDIVRSERSVLMWSISFSLAITVMLAFILMPLIFMIYDRLPKHCNWG